MVIEIFHGQICPAICRNVDFKRKKFEKFKIIELNHIKDARSEYLIEYCARSTIWPIS